MVTNRPSLSQYAETAARFLKFSLLAVSEFDEDYCRIKGAKGDRWYLRPDGTPEPTNHVHCIGATLVNLYALTGAAHFSQRR